MADTLPIVLRPRPSLLLATWWCPDWLGVLGVIEEMAFDNGRRWLGVGIFIMTMVFSNAIVMMGDIHSHFRPFRCLFLVNNIHTDHLSPPASRHHGILLSSRPQLLSGGHPETASSSEEKPPPSSQRRQGGPPGGGPPLRARALLRPCCRRLSGLHWPPSCRGCPCGPQTTASSLQRIASFSANREKLGRPAPNRVGGAHNF